MRKFDMRKDATGNSGTTFCSPALDIRRGDAIELLMAMEERPDLIVTDPPYAFGGSGDEHAISATVAIVLRESAKQLKKGGWMIVFCASSWRSTSYMVESVRGLVEPVRIATWCKPEAKTKTRTPGWKWASVNVVAMRKGKGNGQPADELDHITMAPVKNGRRAELPREVAAWAVRPFVVKGGLLVDPFAGSMAIPKAALDLGMNAIGFEKQAS